MCSLDVCFTDGSDRVVEYVVNGKVCNKGQHGTKQSLPYGLTCRVRWGNFRKQWVLGSEI